MKLSLINDDLKWQKVKNNKPNVRFNWNPGRVNFIFVSGHPFTPYQEFLPNFECLCRIQRPSKTSETRFCDLKWRNYNAIIAKIVESEVDFRVLLHRYLPITYRTVSIRTIGSPVNRANLYKTFRTSHRIYFESWCSEFGEWPLYLLLTEFLKPWEGL